MLNKELDSAIQKIYQPAGLIITTPAIRETESTEYSAYHLGINGQHIIFRVAKTTPTKIGQVVTVWKRFDGKTAPFDITDNIGFFVIHVSDNVNQGQFIFDQKTLIAEGILSTDVKIGKMAFRLYPPWTKPTAKAAIKSQAWQLKHFFAIEQDGKVDLARVCKLFNQM